MEAFVFSFFLKRTSFYALTSENNSIDQELLYGFLHTFMSQNEIQGDLIAAVLVNELLV